MKKLLVLAALGWLCFSMGVHQKVAAAVMNGLGVGKGAYGIAANDPLGTPQKLDDHLLSQGFEGDPYEPKTVRSVNYVHPNDEKLYKDFPNFIRVKVGDDEYTTKITGVFVGTQHAFNPQKRSNAESAMTILWETLSDEKIKFKKIEGKPLVIPVTLNSGKALEIPQWHMEATFDNGDVKGRWIYTKDYPLEMIEFEVK